MICDFYFLSWHILGHLIIPADEEPRGTAGKAWVNKLPSILVRFGPKKGFSLLQPEIPPTDGNFCHPKTTVFGPILKSILCYGLWWFPTPCWRKNCRQERLWWAGISSTGSEWHLSLPEHCWLIAGQEQQVSPRRTLQTVNWPDRDIQYLVGRDWWGGRVQRGRRGVRLVRGWRQNLIRSRSCSAGWWGHWWVAWGLRKERRGLIIVHIIIISVTRISMIIIISVMTIFLNSATILVSDKLVPSSSYLSLIFETDKHKKKRTLSLGDCVGAGEEPRALALILIVVNHDGDKEDAVDDDDADYSTSKGNDN